MASVSFILILAIMKTSFKALFNPPPMSKFSNISPGDLEHYVGQLNPNQTSVLYHGEFIYLEWMDRYTFYRLRFGLDGKFIKIDRQVWYEYPFPFFIRRVMMEINFG